MLSKINPIISVICSIILFLLIIVLYSNERVDIITISLIFAVIACLIAYFSFGTELTEFIGFIEFDALIFIICMQIIVSIAEKYRIFQWIAIKAIQFTKGHHRKFFYLICILASLSSAIISDITVGVIFVPIVIRSCKILEIDPVPYLLGLCFTINIGSIYTPFSSSENILIASAFDIDLIWFLKNFTLVVFPILILTLVILDHAILKRISPPSENQKKILLEIMDPNLMISDKTTFITNCIYFSSVIIGFFFVSEAYLVALVGSLLIILLNRKKTGKTFTDILRTIDWDVIIFFISIFLIIGTMQLNGTFFALGTYIGGIVPENQFWAAILILVLIAIVSGFLAQIPTALVFISILTQIYGNEVPQIIIIGFLLGINLGSNFIPQGAPLSIMTLNTAKKYNVEGFTYKILLKNGIKITLFHIFFSILYLMLYSLVVGII
ncbi:SLC13 family permease [Candidatus Lokiarchaeum ossiferum]|uniref:SLC13 family permease n=1 Tax=Candidatus Lokiarchaeum ossiferum TaxID=2951803 RepID=UPI00352CABBD